MPHVERTSKQVGTQAHSPRKRNSGKKHKTQYNHRRRRWTHAEPNPKKRKTKGTKQQMDEGRSEELGSKAIHTLSRLQFLHAPGLEENIVSSSHSEEIDSRSKQRYHRQHICARNKRIHSPTRGTVQSSSPPSVQSKLQLAPPARYPSHPNNPHHNSLNQIQIQKNRTHNLCALPLCTTPSPATPTLIPPAPLGGPYPRSSSSSLSSSLKPVYTCPPPPPLPFGPPPPLDAAPPRDAFPPRVGLVVVSLEVEDGDTASADVRLRLDAGLPVPLALAGGMEAATSGRGSGPGRWCDWD